jgi:hypothetical protein
LHKNIVALITNFVTPDFVAADIIGRVCGKEKAKPDRRALTICHLRLKINELIPCNPEGFVS